MLLFGVSSLNVVITLCHFELVTILRFCRTSSCGEIISVLIHTLNMRVVTVAAFSNFCEFILLLFLCVPSSSIVETECYSDTNSGNAFGARTLTKSLNLSTRLQNQWSCCPTGHIMAAAFNVALIVSNRLLFVETGIL